MLTAADLDRPVPAADPDSADHLWQLLGRLPHRQRVVLVMRYYLGVAYRYADALGPVPDSRVFDWRNALERFKAAGPKRTLAKLEPMVKPGQHLILIMPIIRTASWGAPWTAEIRHRAPQWERALDQDRRFVRIGPVPAFKRRSLPRGVGV